MVFFNNCFLEFSFKKSDKMQVRPWRGAWPHGCHAGLSVQWKALAASWKHKETQELARRKHKAAQAVAGS